MPAIFEREFYVAGGTLSVDSPSYVSRRADRELHDALRRREYCYVLTSRQMGKSSLMVRTAVKLRQGGSQVAILDLTALGQDLTKQQWYAGLTELLLSQIGPEINGSVRTDSAVPPLQCWLRTLEQLASQADGPIVIFIDEIDAVLSLPFPADEFFAAMRELYNRRATDPRLRSLTFCLLGVVSPVELIQNPRTTPFNVGRRIDLTDFEESEIGPLLRGLNGQADNSATKTLRRVLHWTGGHPYLTQRLCQRIAESANGGSAHDVDSACRCLFLESRARERDDNLIFVRERMLRSSIDRAELLTLYREVWRGNRVSDDEANPSVSLLRLAGIVRRSESGLIVRNRIYRSVFASDWIEANMPDAELRRQRAAYSLGLLRATLVAAAVIASVVALAVTAIRERDRSRWLLYASQIDLAQRAFAEFNWARARDLLRADMPQQIGRDLRGFEWYNLWNLTHDNSKELGINDRGIPSFSPNGVAAVAGIDGGARVYDLNSANLSATLLPTGAGVTAVALRQDGRLVAVGKQDGSVLLCNFLPVHCEVLPQRHKSSVASLQFSNSGEQLAVVGGSSGEIWGVAQRRLSAAINVGIPELRSMSFCAGGLIAVALRHEIGIWDRTLHRRLRIFPAEQTNAIAVSTDGVRMGIVDITSTVRIWSVMNGRELAEFHEDRTAGGRALAFSPDGTKVATGSTDSAIRVWDFGTERLVAILGASSTGVTALSFSGDGKNIFSWAESGTARVWQWSRARTQPAFTGSDEIYWTTFSAKSDQVAAAGNDGNIYVWPLDNHLNPSVLSAQERVRFLNFNQDGDGLVVGTKRTLQVCKLTDEHDCSVWQTSRGVMTVAVARDRRILAALDNATATLTVWDLPTHKRLNQIVIQALGDQDPLLGSAFAAMDVSAKGRFIVIGNLGGKVLLVDLAGVPVLRTMADTFSRVYGVSISTDSRYIATGHDDGKIRIWDSKTRQPVRVLSGHNGTVKAVSFSPDDNRLASASDDGSVKIWDVNNGRELVTLGNYHTMIETAAFSPNGDFLAAGGDDHVLRFWDGRHRQ
jgi:WD40 repeat protein